MKHVVLTFGSLGHYLFIYFLLSSVVFALGCAALCTMLPLLHKELKKSTRLNLQGLDVCSTFLMEMLQGGR